MAKKEDKKAPIKSTESETLKKSSSPSVNRPEKSGEVKGPMGVGGIKKPSSGATVKKPSKLTEAARGRFEKEGKEKEEGFAEDKPAASFEEDSSQIMEKKSLPEKTSNTEEHLIISPEAETSAGRKERSKKDSQGMHPKDTTPIILEASTGTSTKTKTRKESVKGNAKVSGRKKTAKKSLVEKVDSEEVKRRILEEKKKNSEEKANHAPAKKMARRKPVKGISAEEKVKLSDTTASEEIGSRVKKTAKDIADRLIPSEEMQEELKELAKSALPDQEEIKETAKKLTKGIIPSADTISKMAENLDTDKDLESKVKKVSGKKKKKEHKESTVDKPVEATLISDYDIHLFKQGKHFHLYRKFGSHLMDYLGNSGVYFALWAPNAQNVSVIGDFNDWDRQKNPMNVRQDESGIWEVFIPEAKNGSIYKYFILSNNGYEVEKGDPFAFLWENPPMTASIVWDLKNTWNDNDWLAKRRSEIGREKAFSIYELHVGSWKRVPEENARSLTYLELAEDLPGYLAEMGFTHVEFMPVMEHPFRGSWGYQITGYFAPSSRFGTPQDFMSLIESLHRKGIGVILDWVPSHFPSDMHGLHYFDGTFLYEHQEKHKGFHPDWQSYIFNYGRNEVRSFLISNALFWLDQFHVDGLRVDAVASMLYLDYSRNDGEWEPNELGGRENLEAISFLKELNEVVYKEFPDTVTIAEESTAWPMVSRPTYLGGLGFGMKWMMGWMHDTLEYFKKDSIHRKHHQNNITFSLNYAFTENFVLPLSHDEVVYGKQALLNKMPGDQWQKFANLRTLYSFMYAHPGTKLLFMGSEFAQTSEWNHDSSLDWHLLQYDNHRKLTETVKTLNHLYRTEAALHENNFTPEGFQWIDINDAENSVISFLRKGKNSETIMAICNFTPVPRESYRLIVPDKEIWKEIFNSDDERFGGSNVKNQEPIETQKGNDSDYYYMVLTLPPLAVIYLKMQ